jgi:NAD+ synthase/NAD+ synthase (glutamine-hydrolysing)
MVGTVVKHAGHTRLWNSLMVVSGGEFVGSKTKELLPTYNIFDESRHFDPGPNDPIIVKINGLRIGLLICEDAWADSELYDTNPLQRVIDVCPDLIVSINASPSNLGKSERRFELFKPSCLHDDGLAAIYVNQVGGQDQIVFDGGSFLMSGNHTLHMPQFLALTRDFLFENGSFRQDLVSNEGIKAGEAQEEKRGIVLPKFGPVFDKYSLYYNQALLGLRDYTRRCGFRGVVVGCSGGIDSAITIGLAADALGPDNVLAVTMPSCYSSEGSVSDSVVLCQNLGVKLITHPIINMFDAHMKGFTQPEMGLGSGLTGLAQENLQPRIRGTILMGYSNQFGLLLLTTGNKSEVAVGYCTLYGDTNGGLGLIGDLYKTEVFGLSHYYNRLKADKDLKGIPGAIINKAPSAELAPGQKDSDSLPPYPYLDAILQMELEGIYDPIHEFNGRADFDDTVLKVRKLIAKSEFKRKQSPPIIRMRPIAFGAGRQIPITAKQF